MESKSESEPLKGTSPASMSWGKEKYAQKEQALIGRKIMTGSPTSLATSITKLMSPSAMTQVRGERVSEALRHHEIIIFIKSGLVIVFTPSTISKNCSAVRGCSIGSPSDIVSNRKPG